MAIPKSQLDAYRGGMRSLMRRCNATDHDRLHKTIACARDNPNERSMVLLREAVQTWTLSPADAYDNNWKAARSNAIKIATEAVALLDAYLKPGTNA